MILHIAFSSKSFPTYRTIKGFLMGMNAHMYLEVWLFCEYLTTPLKGAPIWQRAQMHLKVRLESTFSREIFVTTGVTTFEAYLTSMLLTAMRLRVVIH